MPIGLGLGLQLAGGASGGGAPSPNPNLLLWSEALDNAAWTKSGGVVVTADAALDPDGQMTAESVAFPALGSVTQITATPGAVVSGSASVNPSAGLARFTVNGLVDGTPHKFSVYLANSTGSDAMLSLLASGGFVGVRIRDGGDGATFTISWAKLETPSLTAYVKREGV